MENISTSPLANTSQSTAEWSTVNRGIYTLGVLSVFCAITANTIILVCFYRTRTRPWSSFTRQTCSMTISDLLVGFTAIPFLIFEHTEGMLNGILCFATFYTFFATQCVTLFHVLGICVLRNIKIKSVAQQGGGYNDQSSARRVIALAWSLSLLVIMVPFILWGEPSSTTMLCFPNVIFGANFKQAMTYIGMTYFSSQCFTNLIYVITCFRFWRIAKKTAPLRTGVASLQVATTSTNTTSTNTTCIDSTSRRSKQKQKRTNTRQVTTIFIGNVRRAYTEQPSTSETPNVPSAMTTQRRVIGTIGILLLLFNVFTLPLTVKLFVEEPETPRRDLRFIMVSLFLVNSAINPIVYATRVTALREAVVQLFKDVFCVCF